MSRCKDLFAEASELTPSGRAALLDRECRDDPQLRSEVERLLAAFDRAGDFLESPAVDRRKVTERSDRVGARIGNYVVRAPLGEGGMGVVWKAEQTDPVRREVALKLLKPGSESREVLARFEAERQALERMEHPNVARVLDAGLTDGGRPFVVMELVRGAAITTFCDARRLTVPDRLRLFVTVCRAVQHAHAKGIIHRDLKPSNILVSDDGHGPVAKVIDFGIARAVDRPADETNHTRNLLLLGTPSYVSPEQAVAGTDIDTRTDVYSLGAVLYELLCGVPPFDPHGLSKLPADELLRRLRHDDPMRPSRRFGTLDETAAVADARGTTPTSLCRSLSGDLDRIVMMALEKDPGRRYETAAALADDIERFLRYEPVTATRPSAGYHALKFARRNRTGLVAGVLVLMSMLAGTGVSVWQAVRATESELRAVANERRAIANERRAIANEEKYRRVAFISDLNLADEAFLADDPRRMKELLGRYTHEEGREDLRGFAWHYLDRHCTAPGGPIDRFDGTALFVCLSPDGSRLAAGGGDGTIRLYDARTWRRTAVIPSGQVEVNGLAFSPDGAVLASAGDDGTVKLWDVAAKTKRKTIHAFEKQAYQVRYARAGDETLLAVCGNDPTVRLFDAATGEPRGELPGHQAAVEAIAVSADGRLAAASEDGVPRLWSLATRELDATGPELKAELTGAAFGPDGRYVVFGTSDPYYLIWDTRSGKPPRRHPVNAHRPGQGEGAQSLAFGPAGDVLFAADRGGTVRTVSLRDMSRPHGDLTDGRFPRWAAHGDRIYSIAVTPDGRQVITACRDGAVAVWRPFEASDAWTIRTEAVPSVRDIAVGPDGTVAVAGDDAVGLYHFETGQLRTVVASPGTRFNGVAISPDGRFVVTGTRDGRVAFTELHEKGAKIRWDRTFPGDVQADVSMTRVRMTPDGRYVAVIADPDPPRSKEVRLLNGATGDIVKTLATPGAYDIAFSPDGSTLAASHNDVVLLVDVPSLTVRRELVAHAQSINAMTFNSDGTLLATGAGDRCAIVWDVATGEMKKEWLAHDGEVESVAFSPDGRTLLTTGADQTPKLWDIATERLMLRLPQLDHLEGTLMFLPDGRTVVGPSVEEGFYVFDGRPADEAHSARR